MDRIDWVILRDLYRWDATNLPQGPRRVSLRELAVRTGIHRNTVQARLAGMRREGVLEGIVFEPRPGPLGLVRSGFLFGRTRFPNADAMMEALEPFPFISSAVLSFDQVFLHLWHRPDRSPRRDAESIRVALASRDLHEGYVSSRFPPDPGDAARLSQSDLRLILGLRRAPSRPLAAVGRDLGLPTRTVERRVARLVQRGIGGMVPRFRPAKVQGWVLVHYVAESERSAPGLAAAFPDRVLGPFGAGQVPTVLVPMSSLAEVEERRWKAEQLPGVGPLRVVLVLDAAYPEPFEDWLAGHVESIHPGRTRLEIVARA